MADEKITELPAFSGSLSGSEVVPIVDILDDINKKITITDIFGADSFANILTTISDQITAALNAPTDSTPRSGTGAGAYTFAIGDELNVILEGTNLSAATWTIPDDTVDFADGSIIEVVRVAAQITFVGASGVLIDAPNGLVMSTPFGVATLRKRSSNHWHVVVA